MNTETTQRPGRPKDTAKREEIVVAATDLFMEKGYELTSMEAVAKRANVSKLTIYSHFADKTELFRAIIQYRCDKVCLPESFEAEAQMEPQEALTKIAQQACRIMYRADSLRLTRVIYSEVVHHPEVVEVWYSVGPRRVKTAFTDLLRSFNEQKKLEIPDATRASEQFFSLLKGERMQRTLMMMAPEPTATELAEHIAATVSFFLAVYQQKKSH